MKPCDIDMNTLKCRRCGMSYRKHAKVVDVSTLVTNCKSAAEEDDNYEVEANRGAGWYLTRYLYRLGFAKAKGCGCEEIAIEMDRNGPQWCRDNLDKITRHMIDQAKKRKWLYKVALSIRDKEARELAERIVLFCCRLAERCS